jgi:hypothetical protein
MWIHPIISGYSDDQITKKAFFGARTMLQPKYRFKAFAAILLASLFFFSCADESLPPDGGGVTVPGILQTDEFGNILGGDTTDWCLNDPNGFSFGPAFPNPTNVNSLQVKLQTPVTDTVLIYFLISGTDTAVFYEGVLQPGSYTFSYLDSMNQFANSYQRLYLRSKHFTASDYCRFYGDVKFEP